MTNNSMPILESKRRYLWPGIIRTTTKIQPGRTRCEQSLYGWWIFIFRVEPTEVSINNDSIDIEMRIYEGPQATIDKSISPVMIAHTNTSSDREIRTPPGQKFSRSAIIRSQRQIINLGYFDQEKVNPDTDVHPERGTVDITYNVVENHLISWSYPPDGVDFRVSSVRWSYF